MKMEFIFDEEKIKENGLTKEQCFNLIRNYFRKSKSKTIKEISNGVYIGEEKDWNIFGTAAILPYTNWFLKVIKEWNWYVDEQDGKGMQKEDCLEAYYQIKAVNG